MGDVTSTLNTVLDVAGDPYLPEVVCRIQQLEAIDHGQPVPTCAETPDTVQGAQWAANLLPVMRGYVYAQQNKWVYPVAVALVLGIPMLIGYELGRSSSR
jgi:hypothetical protein